MQSLIRLTLLGCFAAVGIASAVAVAVHTQPATLEAPFQLPSHRAAAGPSASENTPAGGFGRPTATAEPTAARMAGERFATDRQAWELSRHAARPAGYRPPVGVQIDAEQRADGTLRQRDAQPESPTSLLPPSAEPAGSRLLNTALAVLQKTIAPEPAATAAPEPTPAADDDTDSAAAASDHGTDQLETIPSPAPWASDRRTTANIVSGEGDGQLVININDRDIREVLELLGQQGGLNILASKSVTGNVSASLNGVDIDTALDAILKSTGFVARREGKFIFVGTPEDLLVMDQTQDRIATRIYRPNYVSAAELQSLVAPVLSKNVGQVTVSTPAETGIPADNVKAGGDAFAGGDVLLIRDYESVLKQIDRIVQQVDCRPQQVAIEAMILSVKLNDSHRLGIDFESLMSHDKTRVVSGSPLTNLANVDVSEGGLKFGFLDSSLAVFLDALETVGDANVIASPRLMCLNKQRAEILIGSQLGYVSTTVTENAATQAIEFLEVGTQLRLRPFISNDGIIRMEVHPELSTGSVRVQEGFTLPDKEVTQVTTNIMCPDGATMIIGGLIREDLASDSNQIPLLGNLPVLGAVFRQKNESLDRREIVVLITPRIVYDDVIEREGHQAKRDFLQRQQLNADSMSPVGKRYFGRRYLRLAQSAWAAGQTAEARRYVDLSLHYDPSSREALQLHNELGPPCESGVCDATTTRTGNPLQPDSPPFYHDTELWSWSTHGHLPPEVIIENETSGDEALELIQPGIPTPAGKPPARTRRQPLPADRSGR